MEVASGVKSMGPRPVLPSHSMRSSEKIPQPDTGLGIHEAVFTSDGIFGSDRSKVSDTHHFIRVIRLVSL
jgi:hypothetical protein